MEGFYEKKPFNINCLTLFSYSPVKSETVTENDIQLRNDVIYIMLYPFIQKELDKQYGNAPQTECDKIIKIEKLPIGTYMFNVTVQSITFDIVQFSFLLV